MEQLELFEIQNPCINICEANLLGYCKGCFRNRAERINWNYLDNIQKSKILKKCGYRKHKISKISQKQEKENHNQQNKYQLNLFKN